jgi:hypothetical protein
LVPTRDLESSRWLPTRRPTGRRDKTAATTGPGGGRERRSAGRRARRRRPRGWEQAKRVAADLEVITGGLPWLHAAPRYLVATVLRPLVAAGWTAADVAAQARIQLDAEMITPLAAPAAPAAYLRWLLAGADPARPPAQASRQAAREQAVDHRARLKAQRAAYADRAAAAVSGTARSAAPDLDALRRQLRRPRRGPHTAPGQDRLRAARDGRTGLEALDAALAAQRPDGLSCVAGCHTSGPTVQMRPTPAGPPAALCPDCWQRMHAAW